MKSCMFRSVSIAVAFFVGTGPIPSHAFDIHYLSVGNAAYRDEKLTIPDANTSARQIAGLLRRIGAKDGITLLSEEKAFVTEADVKNALGAVADTAVLEKDPLVVYYFIGHGRTAEPGGVHVSLTGNYDDGNAVTVSNAIETDDLRKLLEDRGVPYILMLDNCYFRDSVGGVEALGRTVSDKMFGMSLEIGALEFPAKVKPSPRIVIYAASPGNVTRTLPHPKSDSYAIGPLARRLLLLLDEPPEKDLSVQALFDRMTTDRAFDPESVAGHSDADVASPQAILVPAIWPSEIVEGATRRGSAGGD